MDEASRGRARCRGEGAVGPKAAVKAKVRPNREKPWLPPTAERQCVSPQMSALKAMTNSRALRAQLVQLQGWSDAHAAFDRAVADIPARKRGLVPKGLQFSAWQLVEHIRLAQADILEFCIRKNYQEKTWPADYWPASPKPPSHRAWTSSLASYRRDRRRLERLIMDPRRALLAKVQAGTGQTYLRECLLVADHTAYHVGQLVMLRRLLGCWRAA
jgi:Protein of unknown function (DUF664)